MSDSINQCPYCGKEDCIGDVPFLSVERYGSQNFNVICTGCGGALKVFLRRTVVLDAIYKARFDSDDWGNAPKHTKDEVGK